MLSTLTRKQLKYSRTVTSLDGMKALEIHTTGHWQVGPRDPQGSWRDAKGARPDFGHGPTIHHRTRKGQRDRRNRQGFDDPADAGHSTYTDAAAGDAEERIG
jgi:hypothetical protein